MDPFTILSPSRCALLVIDPQERLMAAIHKAEQVVQNMALAIRAAKEFSIPIIVTTQYKKGIGPIVPALEGLLEGIEEYDKVEFDAFTNGPINDAIEGLPASCDTLVLTGVETHICIHQTAISAVTRGFNVVILEDAVSSRNKRHKKAAIENFRSWGLKVCPVETLIFEFLKKAGTKEFKALLPYIK